MSLTSESSGFEYRRRLPEVPRAVRFSGDVLNRIDDVAEKIDSVGSRMRQVENIIHDYKAVPARDTRKDELLRIRDEVNRTLNHIAENADGPNRAVLSDYQSRQDTDEIRAQLRRVLVYILLHFYTGDPSVGFFSFFRLMAVICLPC